MIKKTLKKYGWVRIKFTPAERAMLAASQKQWVNDCQTRRENKTIWRMPDHPELKIF